LCVGDGNGDGNINGKGDANGEGDVDCALAKAIGIAITTATATAIAILMAMAMTMAMAMAMVMAMAMAMAMTMAMAMAMTMAMAMAMAMVMAMAMAMALVMAMAMAMVMAMLTAMFTAAITVTAPEMATTTATAMAKAMVMKTAMATVMTMAAETVMAIAMMTATMKVMVLAMAMASICSLYNSNSNVQNRNFCLIILSNVHTMRWSIGRWCIHYCTAPKPENGRKWMPPPLPKLDLTVPALSPHTRNANDRTRNTSLPERGLTYTLYLQGHLLEIYKIFLNPIDRTTDSDPVTTMVVFNSNRKYFATFQLNSALHIRLIITLMSTFNNGSTKSPSGPILVGPLFLYKP
jgi:hypothetical protein